MVAVPIIRRIIRHRRAIIARRHFVRRPIIALRRRVAVRLAIHLRKSPRTGSLVRPARGVRPVVRRVSRVPEVHQVPVGRHPNRHQGREHLLAATILRAVGSRIKTVGKILGHPLGITRTPAVGVPSPPRPPDLVMVPLAFCRLRRNRLPRKDPPPVGQLLANQPPREISRATDPVATDQATEIMAIGRPRLLIPEETAPLPAIRRLITGPHRLLPPEIAVNHRPARETAPSTG